MAGRNIGSNGGTLRSLQFDFTDWENVKLEFWKRGTSSSDGELTLYYQIDDTGWVDFAKIDVGEREEYLSF